MSNQKALKCAQVPIVVDWEDKDLVLQVVEEVLGSKNTVFT